MLGDLGAILMREVFLPFSALDFGDRCLAAGIALGLPAGYVYILLRYRSLAAAAARIPHLAPILVRGGIAEQLGAREAGLLLRAHWSALTASSRRGQLGQATVYATEAVGREFRYAMALAIASLTVRPAEQPEEYKLQEELVLRVGGIQIPIGAAISAVLTLLRIVPVPFRDRYRSQLIQASLVTIGEHTQLIVARAGAASAGPAVLTVTKPVKDLAGISDLVRDAVFMILHLHGRTVAARDWRSMRYVADGLDALDAYTRGGEAPVLAEARDCFRRAAEAGWDNHEALYLYGSLLMTDLTAEGIARAVRMLGAAAEAQEPRFRAFVYAGLAYCGAQKFHRLAGREPEVLEGASRAAERAMTEWAQAGDAAPHPLLLATHALVMTVDEGTAATREDAKRRFAAAARLYHDAIASDPENGTFHNNLGWVMLKLAEWGAEPPAPGELPASLADSPAGVAERYLRRSVEINPTNKLSHANLCLLYATAAFRSADGGGSLQRSRYHGIMAIRLDPKYINGHRDLAFSLLRHGQADEAYRFFIDAVRLAPAIEKDQELIRDALSVLDEVGASDEEKQRWREPPPALLVPPDAGPPPR